MSLQLVKQEHFQGGHKDVEDGDNTGYHSVSTDHESVAKIK